MTFYTGTMFPEEYNGTIFNAQHGSWDRDFAIGYRVMNIGVNEEGQSTSYTNFANGWLNTTLAPSGDNAWGEHTAQSQSCIQIGHCLHSGPQGFGKLCCQAGRQA